MAGFNDFINLWRNIGEIDIRPIREQAIHPVKIALIGAEGSGRQALADQMRCDPARPGASQPTPVFIADLKDEAQVWTSDLVIVLVNVSQQDFSQEQALAKRGLNARKKVLIFFNKTDDSLEKRFPARQFPWDAPHLLVGSVDDTAFLQKEFVPAVIALLPDQLLSLGRHFPLFRLPIAHHLISDTALSNAAYSLSTGLVEIIPVLDLPLNVTDMVVLTKTQAFMVYRLGLLLGYSTRFQDYVAEFGSIVGGGFLWRQLARMLVGLIPVWGIIPEAAVAYAGTYVVGQAVLRWYLTGRHVSPRQIKELYRQYLSQGRSLARLMLGRMMKFRLGKPRQAELLPAGRPARSRKRPIALLPPRKQTCPLCKKTSAPDALFCQYCGHALASVDEKLTPSSESDAGT